MAELERMNAGIQTLNEQRVQLDKNIQANKDQQQHEIDTLNEWRHGIVQEITCNSQKVGIESGVQGLHASVAGQTDSIGKMTAKLSEIENDLSEHFSVHDEINSRVCPQKCRSTKS